jgi:hypothetical protein
MTSVLPCPLPRVQTTYNETTSIARSADATSARPLDEMFDELALLFTFSLTTAPGKLQVRVFPAGSRVPYCRALAGGSGHAKPSFAGQLLTISKHRSSQGNISLYGPGLIFSSIIGLRLLLYPKRSRWVALNAALILLANGMVPSGRGALMLRGWSHTSSADQSSHLGIRTEHNHVL